MMSIWCQYNINTTVLLVKDQMLFHTEQYLKKNGFILINNCLFKSEINAVPVNNDDLKIVKVNSVLRFNKVKHRELVCCLVFYIWSLRFRFIEIIVNYANINPLETNNYCENVLSFSTDCYIDNEEAFLRVILKRKLLDNLEGMFPWYIGWIHRMGM